jgi:hypothetical protein
MVGSRSAVRSMAGCGGLVLALRTALGCGTILAEEPVAADDGGSDAPSDSGLAPNEEGGLGFTQSDGATGDALPDGPLSCRPALLDDFNAPTWTPALWSSKVASGTAIVGTVSAGTGEGLLQVKTTSSTANDFGYLTHEPDEDCALTVEFRLRIQGNAATSIAVFELVSANRARILSIENQTGALKLVLKAENDGSAEVPSPVQTGSFHHVVLRYEPSGAMSLKVDNGAPVSLPAVATNERASRIRIGNLGATESISPGSGQTLFFDDMRIE